MKVQMPSSSSMTNAHGDAGLFTDGVEAPGPSLRPEVDSQLRMSSSSFAGMSGLPRHHGLNGLPNVILAQGNNHAALWLWQPGLVFAGLVIESSITHRNGVDMAHAGGVRRRTVQR
jgi:hypothetical protein